MGRRLPWLYCCVCFALLAAGALLEDTFPRATPGCPNGDFFTHFFVWLIPEYPYLIEGKAGR